MARIVFVPFPEAGHLYASFKLARQLSSCGHDIWYLGIEDFKEPVCRQEFKFRPIFSESIPKGFLAQQASGNTEPFEAILSAAQGDGERSDLLPEFAKVFGGIRPGLAVVDLLLGKAALLSKRCGIATVLLNTQFYDPWEDVRKAADYEALRDIPELVLCPLELDFPRSQLRDNCHYVEASIDEDRKDISFPWQCLDPGKQLIYCSLGSQSHLIHNGHKLLQRVIEAVSERAGWQLVLTTGARWSAQDLETTGCGGSIFVNRAPQLEILKRTWIAITHGGFNSVKECIFHGVPMVVCPLIRDHPAVAARVLHHGLGVRVNVHTISVESVKTALDEIDTNPLFHVRAGRMQRLFRERERAGDAVRIVLSILDSNELANLNRMPKQDYTAAANETITCEHGRQSCSSIPGKLS